MQKLYALKDMLCEELKEFGDKEKIDLNSLETVDKLAHAIKNLDKIIEKHEEEEYGYSNMGYGMNQPMYSNNMSYARGRGRNARRDSMGRYSSRDGYSNMDGGYRELMQDMPRSFDPMGRM